MDALAAPLAAAAAAHGLTADELSAIFAGEIDTLTDRLLTSRAQQATLERITEVAQARATADAELRDLIIKAGKTGVSSATIANAAGMTRQWVSRRIRAHVPTDTVAQAA